MFFASFVLPGPSLCITKCKCKLEKEDRGYQAKYHCGTSMVTAKHSLSIVTLDS